MDAGREKTDEAASGSRSNEIISVILSLPLVYFGGELDRIFLCAHPAILNKKKDV
jgi:hypothetical protein